MIKFFHYAAVTLCTAGAVLAAGNDAPLRGEKAIAALKQQGAYVSFNAAYTAALYAVEPDRDGGYQAWNARQRLTARFGSKGIQVDSAHGSTGLRLVGWGYGNALSAPAAPEMAASGKRIEYRRNGLVEWYVNEAAGIEQGFTLTDPPAGGKAGAPLTIALALRGPLQPELTDQGRAILLRSVGKPELRYAGLKAWDARGRDLPARMELAGDEVRILVDDASAAYPVTIDPAVQQAELTASDGASGDIFGGSVSISGNTVVVGAGFKNNRTGAAYVFVRSGTAWTQQAELTASDGVSGDVFGLSVSISGDTVVAGAYVKNNFTGAAYVFVRSGTTWSQQAELTASDGVSGTTFGFSVSVSGNTLAIGTFDKNTGAAYVFVRSGSTWTQQAELTAPHRVSGDIFGFSVAVQRDTLVVGAWGTNNNTGAAYVFVRSGTTWTHQAKLTASDGVRGDYFGGSVSVSGDTAVVGANFFKNGGTGAAYVFVRGGTVWTQQAELTDPHPVSGDYFGGPVSVSGNIVVAGASGKNSNTGAAFVFVRSGTTWTQHARLTASDGVSGDFFGGASMSGNTVVVGAGGKNSYTGAAYVYIVQP